MTNNSALEKLLHQHSLTYAKKKSEVHSVLDTKPYFEVLFDDAYIGEKKFKKLFLQTIEETDGGYSSYKFNNRPGKILNLASYFYHVVSSSVSGAWAEVGVFNGFGSLFLCRVLASIYPEFKGENFHMIDSFEGVSNAESHDHIYTLNTESGKVIKSIASNTFTAEFDLVSKKIKPYFPAINLHKGWVPEVFDQLEEQQWAFVHVDVDQYQPTYDCLCYFYPRLSPGGVLVNDDYGAPLYPGAKKAWKQFCNENNIHYVILDSGQAVILK